MTRLVSGASPPGRIIGIGLKAILGDFPPPQRFIAPIPVRVLTIPAFSDTFGVVFLRKLRHLGKEKFAICRVMLSLV